MPTIENWINDELVTLDTDDVWSETFAFWDARVPTQTAEAIATATVNALLAKERIAHLSTVSILRPGDLTF